jgi:nucleotidyltransferase substrate binding protein (TIGR01987 family)
MTVLNLDSLELAFNSFEIAVLELAKRPLDLLIRDAAIQRFEYTYELAVKMIKRQLEIEASVPENIDAMGFKDRIRSAAEKQLIVSPEQWFVFREMRNMTSHTYDNQKADEIVQVFPVFLAAVRALIFALKSRHGN